MKKFLLISLLIFFAGFAANSFAQTAAPSAPRILLTWSSNTYVPPDFAGKTMPTANSYIVASVELIDGGKIIDLSKQNIYWYGNDNFIAGGIGVYRATFRAPDVAGGTIDLRVEIPNYSKGSQLKTIQIPIARPEAIIEAPFPLARFSSSPLKLLGQPYFFNAVNPSRLNFSWLVNGQAPSGAENPQNLSVKFGAMISGSPLSVSLSIQNADSRYQFENASKNLDLIYSQ